MAHLHSARFRVSSVVNVKPSYGHVASFLMLGSFVVLFSLLELSAAHKPPADGSGSDSGSGSGPGDLIPGVGSGLFPGGGSGSGNPGEHGSGSGGVLPGGGGSGPGDVFPRPGGGEPSGKEESYGHGNKCAKTCEWWESNVADIAALSKGHATPTSTLAQAFGDAASTIFGGGKTLLVSLKDKSEDGFSQLGRHGAAAYLNALSSHSFQYTPDQVKSDFSAALASKEAALKQSRLFANANFKLKVPNCL